MSVAPTGVRFSREFTLGLISVGLMGAIFLGGCGGKSSPKGPASKNDSPTIGEQTIRAGSGSSVEYTSGANRKPYLEISWQTATLKGSDANNAVGVLTEVQGKLFRNGVAVATFSADTGTLDRVQRKISLNGTVKLVSKGVRGNPSLSCDSIEYTEGIDEIRAVGNVTITGDAFSLGPSPALYTNLEFSQFATPELFKPGGAQSQR